MAEITKRSGARSALLCALLGTAIACAAVAEETLTCYVELKPGESIQSAIDAAPDGALICLAEGRWDENVRIGKSITLRGSAEGPARGFGEPWKRARPVDFVYLRIADAVGHHREPCDRSRRRRLHGSGCRAQSLRRRRSCGRKLHRLTDGVRDPRERRHGDHRSRCRRGECP